jgi:glycosyltransferase involved in cell wall biosynthesis
VKQLLVIGHTFPEPSTTAAGNRMLQIITLFKEEGYHITFVSTASISENSFNLESLQVTVAHIELNNPSFDTFIKNIAPTIVLFDRYITEEQFGWRVVKQCPTALRILDTEDLHFLRKARHEAVKNNLSVLEANLYTDTAKRELASILRCDLSLIISEFEMELLQDVFKISPQVLYYLPFLVQMPSIENRNQTLGFIEREGFITIGNFLHAPNVDAVLQLKKEIWPLLKKQLPNATIEIYGAYASQQIKELHNKEEGFLIKGWAEEVSVVMQKAKVCLVPIRFGAGLKGKLLDAMVQGLPSVTSTIGAEGMNGNLSYSGIIADNPKQFVEAATQLYTDEKKWKQAQNKGFQIIEKRFNKALFSEDFKTQISSLLKDLNSHRNNNFIGQILQHQTLQSTKYMSKWIEAKNATILTQSASNVCFENSDEVRDEYRDQPKK